MRSLSRSTFIWLALLAALFVLAVAAPLAAAAGPELRAAPLSAEFLRYQADFKLRHTLGLDRVPGFRPGLVPAPMDISYLKGARSAPPMATYATSYDLRTLNRVSPVKDQDPYSTCWTFAALGSLESSLLPGETSDFSEDNMVLTSGFNFPGTLYDAGGNYLMSTAYLVRWGGPVNETEDAYGDNLTPPGLTSRKHVQEVNWIPPRGSALDNDSIKSAVTQYGGAYVSMGWYGSSGASSYYNATTASYYYDGSSDTNHAVLIVGWDDNYSAANFATTPAGNGAFIVKNSWGASWGSNGYFYVSYYDSKFGRDDLMAVFDNAESTSNYGGIYQYDPLGDGTELGYSSSTGWFANVFSAQTTASLSAVGFYTLAPGTSYEVYTGSSLATKTLRTSGTLAYMGYHTVTLPSAVGITSGQQFVVTVKVTSPGTTAPIAIEAPLSGYSSAATAKAGQSYVSPSGSSWTDLTTIAGYTKANVCLKAYTTGSGPTTTPTPTATPTPTPTPTPTVAPRVTLKLSGLTSGAMRLGRRVTAKGKVTPASLAGSKVKLTVQKKRGARWVKVKSVARTISATCAYSWKYKPARRGAYRMRATIAKTAAHTAARTKWRPFKVK
jgi:C1A family cysteine protease